MKPEDNLAVLNFREDNFTTVTNTGPETTRTYRCILPPGKLSAYPENAHLCINNRDQPKHFYQQCTYESLLKVAYSENT